MASRTEQSLREVEMQGINTKWIATVASIWIQCCSGATYTFGIYSSTLKSTQNYDQSTLDTVSVFKDIGANVGVLSGLLYSFVTFNHRSRLHFLRGPWVVLATGAILCFAGYFLMWASVVGLIHRPPVLLMCLFMFTAAHSQTFLNTGNVVTGVMNFGDYSGTIVGIMKVFAVCIIIFFFFFALFATLVLYLGICTQYIDYSILLTLLLVEKILLNWRTCFFCGNFLQACLFCKNH